MGTGGPLVYVVAIKRTAIEQVEGPAEAEEEGQRRCPNPTTGRVGVLAGSAWPGGARTARRKAANDEDDQYDQNREKPPESRLRARGSNWARSGLRPRLGGNKGTAREQLGEQL